MQLAGLILMLTGAYAFCIAPAAALKYKSFSLLIGGSLGSVALVAFAVFLIQRGGHAEPSEPLDPGN